MNRKPPPPLQYERPPTVRPQLSKRAEVVLMILFILGVAVLALCVIA